MYLICFNVKHFVLASDSENDQSSIIKNNFCSEPIAQMFVMGNQYV
jgi:hypothetical protein